MDEQQRAQWERGGRQQGFIRVRFRLLTAEEGGRQGPIGDGYRASWDIGNRTESGERMLNDGPMLFEDGDGSVSPGAGGVARIHPTAPESWADVRPGLDVVMYEGSRVVGRAEVLEVVNASPDETSNSSE